MKKNRSLQYEFVRCAALFLMICVHSNQRYDTGQGSPTWKVQKSLQIVFLLCNGIFYIMSGKFALNAGFDTDEDIKNYYKKKVSGLIVPIFLFMLIQTIYDCYAQQAPIFPTYFTNVWSTYSGTHDWFLYTLVGNLLFAPFLGRALQSMGDKPFCILIGITAAFNTLTTIGTNKGLLFAWGFPISGWSLYFALGYGIERVVNTDKKRGISYIISAGALLVSFYLVIHQKWVSKISDLSPVYLLAVSGAYLFLTQIYTRSHGRVLDGFVRFIGKYSFAAYMVHMMVLRTIIPYFPGRYRYWPLIAVVTYFLSILCGFVAQFLLVRPVTAGLNRLMNRRKRV